jgi:hypothetical protein
LATSFAGCDWWRDEPHIDLERFGFRPPAQTRRSLQHTQQFDLERSGDIADLSETAAAMRQLEDGLRSVVGAGKRPLLMAEYSLSITPSGRAAQWLL